jgi:hypothetical protein
MTDHFRYDLLTQQALRGVVRNVLTEVVKKKVLPGDHHFYIGGIPEKLGIPYEAINGFFDPSVQFGLQFEEVTEGQDRQAPANVGNKPPKKKRATAPTIVAPVAKASLPAAAAPPEPKFETPLDNLPGKGGGQVVRLDRFRKKK